ncbi:MAG TPA: peptidoglycan-binding domain-containing protein [Bryobacteraceae bacterium]|nr:peptidoglycan-binding domain-containing protein [Bryobacteraceae bacterium]
MGRILCLAGALALVAGVFAADGTAPKKKPPAKTAAKSATSHKTVRKSGTRTSPARKTGVASARRRTGTTHAAASSKSASRKGRTRAAVRRPAARRQLEPTPQRYQQIQEALASKGYLPSEQANGKWTDASVEALKKFQTDQNLDATGKINSLSLIALGLGPKHDSGTAAKPAAGPTPAASPTPPAPPPLPAETTPPPQP